MLLPASVQRSDAYSSEEPGRSVTVATAGAGGGSGDDFPGLQRFLEQMGVIPTGETFSSAAELLAYVRVRMSRS